MIPTKEQIEEIACLEQRSLAWHRARLGCVTGSCTHFVMKKNDTEKALEKALAAGPQFTESKTEFNARLRSLSGEEKEKAQKLGQKRETYEEFEARISKLKNDFLADPFSDTTMGYLYQLARERNLREAFRDDDELFNQYLLRTSFSSSAIRWGEDSESTAREQYEKLTGNEVVEVGFHRHPTTDWFGDSPDGLVVDSESGKPIGAIEIKCPKSETWMRYRHEFRKAERLYNKYVKAYMETHPEINSDAFRDDLLPVEQRLSSLNLETLKRVKNEYYWQCQSHCECNDVEWCDFVFYDVMMKNGLVVIRIYRNQDDIELMLKRIKLASDYIDNEILA